MRAILLAAALLATGGMVHAGQLYKWVDADGKVHYTDQPPPPDARKAERKKLGDKPGTQGLPYALQEATRRFPVTLYTASDCGDACKQASAYLSKRGVPHKSLDARDPAAADALSALTGGKLEVPVMTVGNTTVRGCALAWDAIRRASSKEWPARCATTQRTPPRSSASATSRDAVTAVRASCADRRSRRASRSSACNRSTAAPSRSGCTESPALAVWSSRNARW